MVWAKSENRATNIRLKLRSKYNVRATKTYFQVKIVQNWSIFLENWPLLKKNTYKSHQLKENTQQKLKVSVK